MNRTQREAWRQKTTRLNEGRTLKRGDVVLDADGTHGVVVKIREPEDTEDHGTIHVWLDTVLDYGDDNCEHYCFVNWQEHLRVEEE